MDFGIKYDMEKYAHSLKKVNAGLEEAVEFALTGKRLTMPVSLPFADMGPAQPRAVKPETADTSKPTSKTVAPEEKPQQHKYRITSPFGQRVSPIDKKLRMHRGIDIGARKGTPVYAFDDGVVIAVSQGKVSGKYITIKHPEEEMVSSYSHLSKQLVRKGQKVKKGDKIGLVGKTGQVTGPHLHFRLKYRGQDVDPELFISDRRII